MNLYGNYVSKSLAKLLSENGYNEKTQYAYDAKNDNIITCDDNSLENCYPCPTLYEAQKWIEATTGMFTIVFPVYNNNDGVVTYRYRIVSIYDLYFHKKGKLCKLWYEMRHQALDDSLIDILTIYIKEYGKI